jgi:glutathione peroxidase
MYKFIYNLLVGAGSIVLGLTQAAAEPIEAANKTIFDYTVKTIAGEVTPLSTYKGKVLLVVNTASKCGFTSQLGDLQKLYEEYKDQGFEVLGFPSNDFGGQEPLDNDGVQKFCSSKFGVTFPLFEKAAVSGPDKQPVYKFLTESKVSTGEPGWNFVKFIVGKDGVVKDRFNSMTSPLSGAIKKRIEGLLKEP